MKIKIMSDSACDLSRDLLEKYDIATAPFQVTLGSRSGPDGVITPDDIYRYVDESGELAVFHVRERCPECQSVR